MLELKYEQAYTALNGESCRHCYGNGPLSKALKSQLDDLTNQLAALIVKWKSTLKN
jgi:hypothetical protein